MDFSISWQRDPFNQIEEDIYLGSRPSPSLVPILKDVGITHVASCLIEEDRPLVDFLKEDFHPLFVPLHDGIHEDILSTLPTFLDFFEGAQASLGRAKVLIHCEAGVSRSAALATAFLMKRRRKPFFETYRDVRAKRHEVLPNIGFASQLQRFEFDLDLGVSSDTKASSLARYLHEVCAVPAELEVLQSVLHDQNYDALKALQSIFGEEIPRVVQGVRL
ncbi:MAG: dual specificity protein phosphatase [Myxococcota bacterium]